MEANPKLDTLKTLMVSAGWVGDFEIVSLPRIGNNRAYRIHGKSGDRFLKAYFHDPEDHRDRLKAEYSFVEFAWNQGLRTVAQPFAQDTVNKLGLYEFIDGTPLRSADIGPAEMKEAAHFFQMINEKKNKKEAKLLGAASEAGFSIVEQLQTVHNRFERLVKIDATLTPVHKEAKRFVDNELRPAWNEVVHFVETEARAGGLDIAALLPESDRCLSPSDFGFHNTLRTVSGLRFFDFEYAGWDDPAKMISDFYHQPRLTVPGHLMPAFVERVVPLFKNPTALALRISLGRPIFGIKWSCIMLNDFLPIGDRKRKFSVGDEGWETRLEERLGRSRSQLKRVFPLNTDLKNWN